MQAATLLTGPNVRGWSSQEYEQARALIAQLGEWIKAQPSAKADPK